MDCSYGQVPAKLREHESDTRDDGLSSNVAYASNKSSRTRNSVRDVDGRCEAQSSGIEIPDASEKSKLVGEQASSKATPENTTSLSSFASTATSSETILHGGHERLGMGTVEDPGRTLPLFAHHVRNEMTGQIRSNLATPLFTALPQLSSALMPMMAGASMSPWVFSAGWGARFSSIAQLSPLAALVGAPVILCPSLSVPMGTGLPQFPPAASSVANQTCSCCGSDTSTGTCGSPCTCAVQRCTSMASKASECTPASVPPSQTSRMNTTLHRSTSSPVSLSMPCDDLNLSPLQCLVRDQIEVFEATQQDIEANAQGRNKPISLGQVGIRCRHCSHLPPKQRQCGAVYFPGTLHGVYQATQKLKVGHFFQGCRQMTPPCMMRLKALQGDRKLTKDQRSPYGGGLAYWKHAASALGVYETKDGLRRQVTRKASANR